MYRLKRIIAHTLITLMYLFICFVTVVLSSNQPHTLNEYLLASTVVAIMLGVIIAACIGFGLFIEWLLDY